MEGRRLTDGRYRRATVAYVAIIVAPTLVLLWLGLQSVRRQRDAVDALRAANLRLSLQQAAERLERHVLDLAASALGDPGVAALAPLLRDPPGPENQRALRVALESVAERHPVATQFLVLDRRGVRFPLATSPLPRRVNALLDGAPSAARARFIAAFSAAEALESRPDGVARAAAAYRQCADMPVPDDLRGLALARVARVYRAARQDAAAARAWVELAERHADTYDLFNRPYALVAGLELSELANGATPAHLAPASLATDLANGRWELSADQAAYFSERLLSGAGGPSGGPPPSSSFLDGLRLATALERTSVVRADAPVGQIAAAAIGVGVGDVLFVYDRLPTQVAGDNALIGFAIDRHWVERQVLPDASRAVGLTAQPVLQAGGGMPTDQDAGRAVVRLQSPLAGWVLATPRLAIDGASFRDSLLIGAGTAAVLGVLVLGVVLLVRDVARESRLAQLRGEFVRGVSHQLRTPLTLIRLYGEMLSQDAEMPAIDRREHLDVITSESERLTALVDRVLDFSRVERGEQPCVLQRGDLAVAVRPVVETYAQYLRRRGFVVDIGIPDGLPEVNFDGDAVGDALVNLMDNASKYSGSTRYVSVALKRHTRGVALEVADRGVGIADEDRAQLFQPFYRGARRREKGGYGLGLFLVREMVRAHGGWVEVESRVDEGSLFRLVFPLEEELDA